MSLLVQAEQEIPVNSAALQAEVAGTENERAITDVIAAIVITRFNGRSLPELCAMGGITLEDFTRSVAYQEIFGQGRQEGELDLALRLLHRRCGQLSTAQLDRIRALPLERIEALGEALLEFRDTSDLEAWLRAEG